jgi:hypothetical protein
MEKSPALLFFRLLLWFYSHKSLSRIEDYQSVTQEVIGQMRFLHNNKGGLAGWLWSAIVVVVLIIVLVVVVRFLLHLI